MNKNIIAACALAVGVIGFGSISTSFASETKTNDDIPFEFTIKPNQDNSYSEYRYRETAYPENEWKVEFNQSGEGSGTYTTFWLQLDNGANCSIADDVMVGTSAYNFAYQTASFDNVCLTAQNNNFNSDSYSVSGYWDEETW